MKRSLNVFFLFFTQAIKIELVYRSQILQRLLGLFVMISVTVFFWLTVSRKAEMQGYTPDKILLYFISACFHDFIFISGDELTKKIGESIRSGKLSSGLIQPFPYLVRLFANGLGGIVLRWLISVPIALLIVRGLVGTNDFSILSLQAFFYAVAFIFAVTICLICLIAAAMLAFDMTEVWAVWVIFVSMYCMFSGYFYPADLATGVIASLMHWLPFYYMLGFPCLIVAGRLGTGEILWGLAHAVFVLSYMTLLLGFLWKRGIKKFEAVGL